MPTQADFDELLKNCDCNYTTQNSVWGMKVTSKKDSSKSIFLPAAGYREGTILSVAGYYGNYWSSSLLQIDPQGAVLFKFYLDINQISYQLRVNGYSVRPVCP